MVNVLRRWNQPIMVLITVLIVVSFSYFGPAMRGSGSGERPVVTVYGKEVTMDDFKRQARRVGIYSYLKGEFIFALDRFAAYRAPDNAVVARSFVLEHEADQLGLTSTAEERIACLEGLPAFQGQDGKFDPEKFDSFKSQVMAPNGFSDSDFEKIFLNGEVRARKLKEIVGSVAAASKSDAREQLIKESQKTETSYVAFRRADFRKDLKATEEDLKKRYEEQKELLKTPEQRKVRYAAFLLPSVPDNKPLEGKERTAKLQKQADAAYAFLQELGTAKDKFDELAKKYGATVGETPNYFTATTVPNELEGSNEIGEKAFALTNESPISTHINLQKGTYVLELLDIKQPEQRKFEDTRNELEEQIVSAKADELAQAKATEVRPKLLEAMKAGKSFADAAKDQGLKVEDGPSFGGARRRNNGQFDGVIIPAASKLAPGEISEVLSAPTNDVKLIASVDYRSAVDDKQIEAGLAAQMEKSESFTQMVTFNNWLAERGRLAGVEKFFVEGL